MPRDEIDPSLITNEPRKQKLASYVTNKDNISADKKETIKRIKYTVDPGKRLLKNLTLFYRLTFLKMSQHLKENLLLSKKLRMRIYAPKEIYHLLKIPTTYWSYQIMGMTMMIMKSPTCNQKNAQKILRRVAKRT
jgi:hypothetical protein